MKCNCGNDRFWETRTTIKCKFCGLSPQGILKEI